MKHFDVIILGAGPGGLFAAREAGRRGLSAVLLEAQDRAGTQAVPGRGRHGQYYQPESFFRAFRQ